MLKTLLADFRKQLEQSEASDRNFGLMVGGAFVLVGIARLHRTGEVRWWAIALGALFLLLSIVAPRSLTKLKRAWLFLGFLLGLVVNPIVLGILFFVVVTPASLLLRLFGHDPLHLKYDPKRDSYWTERSPSDSDMRTQF